MKTLRVEGTECATTLSDFRLHVRLNVTVTFRQTASLETQWSNKLTFCFVSLLFLWVKCKVICCLCDINIYCNAELSEDFHTRLCVTEVGPDWLPWGPSVVSGCGGSWPSAPPPSFGWSHQFWSCRQTQNKQHVDTCRTEQHTGRPSCSRTVVLTCCRCTEPPSLPADAENWDRTETDFMINSRVAAALLHVPLTWAPPRGQELQLQQINVQINF